MTVLLLTGDPALRSALTAASEREGLTIVTVATVAEALRAALSLQVRILVSDPLTLAEQGAELEPLYGALGAEARVIELSAGERPGSPPGDGPSLLRFRRPLDPEQLVAALSEGGPPAVSPLHFDVAQGTVSGPLGRVRLTRVQGRLLQLFAAAEGRPVSAEELVLRVWGYSRDVAGPELVRAHIRNLRTRLSVVDPGRQTVETVPGRGYRLGRPVRLT